MKKNILKLYSIFIILSFSCKDKKPNPCLGLQAVSADFTINELVTSFDSWMNKNSFETDTVLNTSSVNFVPKQSNLDYYEWHIGQEIIKEPTVIRHYFPSNKWISITLIVHSKPNLDCFPHDDGKDTVTKQFFSCGTIGLLPKWGKWFGYFNNNPLDTGTVFTKWVVDTVDKRNRPMGFIFNFPKGNFPLAKSYITLKGSTGTGGATSFINPYFNAENTAGKLYGFIDKQKMINITYYQTEIINHIIGEKIHTFKGKKIK